MHFIVGIGVSIAAHLLFALLALRPWPLPKMQDTVIEVSIVPPQSVPPAPQPEQKITRQIVSPVMPPQSEEKPPEAAKYLSDKDVTAAKESVKRGDDPAAGASLGKQGAGAPQDRQNATIQKESPRKSAPALSSLREEQKIQQKAPLTGLLLDDKTLFEKFSQEAPKPKSLLDDRAQTGSTHSEPFSRPAGSGAAFIGRLGTNDYLPNLPDGDITLLNTKADKYAVFVRRVATAVFAQVRLSGWEHLGAGDINRISDFAVVRAVLDRSGNLVRATVESSSGSRSFDSVLLEAVKKGAKDPNPPESALADDGNFHFIFKSRSWSRASSSARTGAPFERRWLLLATGLL
ncbi:MAG: TonB family protein [Deltaproteobacteria bacterium]|nr:TonB family protein [Deltaproteobacteria bacterium]